MTTRDELLAKAKVAADLRHTQRIIKGAEAGLRLVRKDDAGSGDLAGGGLAAPAQTPPVPGSISSPKHPHKPRGTVVKTVDFRGLPVHIDRPLGHVQTGVDAKGKTWKRIYHVDYGFVPNTQGGDGTDLDVYLGLDKEAKDAHWVLQKKADGTFDEYKVMLGFEDPDMAKGMYLAHTPKKHFGGMATTSVETMKALVGLHPVETMKALAGFAVDVPDLVEKIIKHESDGWHVYSEDGEKHLGGPYDSKAGAVARLAEVEGHKEKALATIEREVRLTKLDAPAPATSTELRYALGIVLQPDVVDAQGDIYSADEIRKAAWGYMVSFRNVGLMHKGLVNQKVALVESYLAPIAMNVGGSVIKAGTWLMGLNIHDDALWDQVKKGALTGLSIGGFAAKNPV
jgi:hypothetical protein